jgi:plastocyanin
MRIRVCVIVAALSAIAAPAALAVPAQVRVDDNFFSPSSVTIDPGESVTWMWFGVSPHNVTYRSGPVPFPPSGDRTGATSPLPFVRSFPTAGRYTYECTIHPFSMQGTIQVGAPPADTTRPVISRLRARGTRLSFRLSERSRVALTVKRGRRTVLRSSRRLNAGRRSISFSARRLRAGRYRAFLRATDASRNASRTVSVRVRVRR